MNRRGFLSILAPAAVGTLVAAELTMPSRSIFLPPAGGWPARPWVGKIRSSYKVGEPDEWCKMLYGKPQFPLAVAGGIDFGFGIDATSVAIYHAGRWIPLDDVKSTDRFSIEYDGESAKYLRNGERIPFVDTEPVFG
jgi:hypothetical protein